MVQSTTAKQVDRGNSDLDPRQDMSHGTSALPLFPDEGKARACDAYVHVGIPFLVVILNGHDCDYYPNMTQSSVSKIMMS